MGGIIVRNLSSRAFSNVRIDKLFPLDEYGIVNGKQMYYLVPKINHTSNVSVNADESIVYNEQGEYFIYWNGFQPVKVYTNTTHDLVDKHARVGGFDRFTSINQVEPSTGISLDSNITTLNPAIMNISFTKPVLVNHLHLSNRNYSSTSTASFRDFTLEGSNDDGDTWDILLTVVDKVNTQGGQFNYSMIDNKKIYRDYRFVITRTHAHGTTSIGSKVSIQSQINLLTTIDKY